MIEQRQERDTAWPSVERRRWPRDISAADSGPAEEPVLRPLHFSTAPLEPAEQFPAWRTYMAPLIETKLPDNVAPQEGFFAEHTAWNLGKMLIVQQRSAAFRYVRSPEKLRSSSIDHWYVGISRNGNAWTEVDGHVAESRVGTVTFRSLGHPYRGRVTDNELTLLYMPYDLFADRAGMLIAANNSILSGNYATLLIDYVSSVEARLSTLGSTDLPKVVDTIRDMLLTCLAGAAASRNANVAPSTLSVMERVHRHIHDNLDGQDLNPDNISRAMGISRTRLYQLFESSGGVLNYIRKKRLLKAYAALSNPTNSQRILDIAEQAGFDVAANFTRAFTNEFGLSPREVRKTASNSRPVPSREESLQTPTFQKWLMELGK